MSSAVTGNKDYPGPKVCHAGPCHFELITNIPKISKLGAKCLDWQVSCLLNKVKLPQMVSYCGDMRILMQVVQTHIFHPLQCLKKFHIGAVGLFWEHWRRKQRDITAKLIEILLKFTTYAYGSAR